MSMYIKRTLEAEIAKLNDFFLFADDNPEMKQSSNLLMTEEAAEYLKLKPNTLER